MKTKTLKVNEIVVPPDRFRQVARELDPLVGSIEKLGLLEPPGVRLVNDEYVLVVGFRRLMAVRALRWDEIDVQVLEDFADELTVRQAEIAENVCRMPFNPHELYAAVEVLLPQAETDAAARKKATQVNGTDKSRLRNSSLTGNGQARDIVGKALGVSGKTVDALRSVYEARYCDNAEVEQIAVDIVDGWSEGNTKKSITAAALSIKKAKEANGMIQSDTEAVKEFFKANPEATLEEAVEATGANISKCSVWKKHFSPEESEVSQPVQHPEQAVTAHPESSKRMVAALRILHAELDRWGGGHKWVDQMERDDLFDFMEMAPDVVYDLQSFVDWSDSLDEKSDYTSYRKKLFTGESGGTQKERLLEFYRQNPRATGQQGADAVGSSVHTAIKYRTQAQAETTS